MKPSTVRLSPRAWITLFGVLGLILVAASLASALATNLGMVSFLDFVYSANDEAALRNLYAAEKVLGWPPASHSNPRQVERREQIERLVARSATDGLQRRAELWAVDRLAREAQQRGDVERALDLNQKIVHELHPGFVPAYYRLWSLYKERGQQDVADAVLAAVRTLEPEIPLAPPQAVDGFLLLGLDAGALSQERARPAPVMFHWQSPARFCRDDAIEYSRVDGWDYYCLGDKVFQLGDSTNLANLNEELRYSDGAGLLGFRLATSPPADRQQAEAHLADQPRNGLSSLVWALSNRKPTRSVLASPDIDVTPNDYYWLSGWVRTTHGAPNAGVSAVCFGAGYDHAQENHTLLRQQGMTEWTRFARVFKLGEEAETCRLLLMNYGDAETVYFDDLQLRQIPLPQLASQP